MDTQRLTDELTQVSECFISRCLAAGYDLATTLAVLTDTLEELQDSFYESYRND